MISAFFFAPGGVNTQNQAALNASIFRDFTGERIATVSPWQATLRGFFGDTVSNGTNTTIRDSVTGAVINFHNEVTTVGSLGSVIDPSLFDLFVLDAAGNRLAEIDGLTALSLEQLKALPESPWFALMGTQDITMYGTSDSDVLSSPGGAGTFWGGYGNDTYVVDNIRDHVLEYQNQGLDTVLASVNYTLPEDVENLTLTGTDNITGTGNNGNNVITGNSGNNVLAGRGAFNTLDGGAGFDTAVYSGTFRQYQLTGNPAGTAMLQGPQAHDPLTSIERLSFLDGNLIFDPGANIAKVERLYLATLDRLPDALGLNFHTARLDGGMTLIQDAQGFVSSPEFQAIYGPSLSSAQFVELLYQNVLHRHSDPGGLAFYVNNLSNGITRGETVTNFSESPEFIQNNASIYSIGLWDIDEIVASIARLYLGALGRPAEVSGLTYHAVGLKAGAVSLVQDATNFTMSPEFQATYGALNNTQFVTQLYLNVLGRAPDSGGLAFHSTNLANGTSRGEVTLGFTESPEYQLKTIGQIDHGIAAVDAHYP